MAAAVLAAATPPPAGGEPERALIVEAAAGGAILLREPVDPGASFVLSYIHSSEHVAVRGTFRVEADGSLRVVETAFAGFGPGLPELEPGDDWRIEDGLIVHRPRDATLTELAVRVAPITRHRLVSPRGATIDLSSLLPAGAAVTIRVE